MTIKILKIISSQIYIYIYIYKAQIYADKFLAPACQQLLFEEKVLENLTETLGTLGIVADSTIIVKKEERFELKVMKGYGSMRCYVSKTTINNAL